jgi:NAD(P)-dependent dehydrogenase (short-subunit alcohol dehydrogenase family)
MECVAIRRGGSGGEPCRAARGEVFLASDRAAFITGETLRVDGGFTQHGPTVADFSSLLALQQAMSAKG